jgi:hypothetical protein
MLPARAPGSGGTPERPVYVRFLKHQVLSIVVTLVVFLLEGRLLSRLPRLSPVIEDVLMLLGIATGLLWGYMIPRPRDYAIARWTWVIPEAISATCLLSDLRSFGLQHVVGEYFNPPPGSEGLGVLITLAATSPVLYSIGAAFGLSKSRNVEKTTNATKCNA